MAANPSQNTQQRASSPIPVIPYKEMLDCMYQIVLEGIRPAIIRHLKEEHRRILRDLKEEFRTQCPCGNNDFSDELRDKDSPFRKNAAYKYGNGICSRGCGDGQCKHTFSSEHPKKLTNDPTKQCYCEAFMFQIAKRHTHKLVTCQNIDPTKLWTSEWEWAKGLVKKMGSWDRKSGIPGKDAREADLGTLDGTFYFNLLRFCTLFDEELGDFKVKKSDIENAKKARNSPAQGHAGTLEIHAQHVNLDEDSHASSYVQLLKSGDFAKDRDAQKAFQDIQTLTSLTADSDPEQVPVQGTALQLTMKKFLIPKKKIRELQTIQKALKTFVIFLVPCVLAVIVAMAWFWAAELRQKETEISDLETEISDLQTKISDLVTFLQQLLFSLRTAAVMDEGSKKTLLSWIGKGVIMMIYWRALFYGVAALFIFNSVLEDVNFDYVWIVRNAWIIFLLHVISEKGVILFNVSKQGIGLTGKLISFTWKAIATVNTLAATVTSFLLSSFGLICFKLAHFILTLVAVPWKIITMVLTLLCGFCSICYKAATSTIWGLLVIPKRCVHLLMIAYSSRWMKVLSLVGLSLYIFGGG